MFNEIKFKNLTELYERILPALKSKVREIHKNNLSYIQEEDIWNYLKDYKWNKTRSLDLGDMVNDIFNIDLNELDDYVKNEMKKIKRNIKQGEI